MDGLAENIVEELNTAVTIKVPLPVNKWQRGFPALFTRAFVVCECERRWHNDVSMENGYITKID